MFTTPQRPPHLPRYFAVMPAGGAGSRLGADMPKQYLDLRGEPMIVHAARALLAAPWIERLVVVVAPADARAVPALAGLPRTTVLAQGGATRRDTVLAGLRWLARETGAGTEAAGVDDDWVLVHDAARPALERAALERLREELADDPVGGLLAMPVSDTVKRATVAGSVAETVPREGLWLAQTPQMFRFALLIEALARFGDVTDEAAAVELSGGAPRLVTGDRMNFKVTTAGDLELMRRLMRNG